MPSAPDTGDASRRPRDESTTPLATAAALAVIGALAFNVLADPLWWLLHPGRDYWSAFESVGGLEPNEEVRYGGIAVGRVRSVELDTARPGRLLVTFRVKPETPVGPQTRAAVVDVGSVLGRYLSLRPDTTQVRQLSSGSEVPTEPSATFETIAVDLAVTLDRTDSVLTAVSSIVDSNFADRMAGAVARLDSLAGTIARAAARTQPLAERTLRGMTHVLARTDTLLATMDSARPALREAPAAAVATLAETRDILAQIRTALDAGGGLTELMRDLNTTGTHLARLSAQLDRDPAGALAGRATLPKTAGPELHDD